MSDAPIHVGTCAFTASGWGGAFYPEGMKSSDYLGFYARGSGPGGRHFLPVECHSRGMLTYARGPVNTVTVYLAFTPIKRIDHFSQLWRVEE